MRQLFGTLLVFSLISCAAASEALDDEGPVAMTGPSSLSVTDRLLAGQLVAQGLRGGGPGGRGQAATPGRASPSAPGA